MESYYDSEEGIAWGPVTLQEIKDDFQRPVIRLPEKRHTIGSSFKMDSSIICNKSESQSEDIPDLCQELAKKLDVSEFSTDYYTPNESLRSESNSDFLEKLSKVVNEPQAELTTYTDALENTKASVTTGVDSKNESFRSPQSSELSNTSYLSLVDNRSNIENSCLNFLKVAVERTTNYDIANFQQTLVENSILSSEDESVDLDESGYSNEEDILHTDKKEQRHTLTQNNLLNAEDEVVIVISDDEESLLITDSTEDVEICKNLKVKQETDFENMIIEENYNTEEIVGENCTFSTDYNDKISISSEEHQDEDESNSISHICTTTEEKEERQDEDESNSIPHSCSTTVETESLSKSTFTVPKIVLNEYDGSTSKNDSLQLNDTLEEMNRLLNEGLDYTMSDEDVIIENTPRKQSNPELSLFRQADIISSSVLQNEPENFLDIKEKRHKIPIRKPQPPSSVHRQFNKFNIVTNLPNANFKVPETPSRAKFANLTPPKCSSNRLKNIVSPVALYIKNSPSMALKQNVPQRDISKIVISKNCQSTSKENCPDFPEVVYKPAKKQIISSAEKITLPPSYKKLNINVPTITKHEGRINQNPNRTKVTRKLLDNVITNNSIEDSMLNTSSDVSVLTNKHAYIK